MSLRQLLERRAAVTASMREIHAANPDGALAHEVEQRWTTLKAEADALEQAISRQALLDEADRRSAGTLLNSGNPDSRFDSEMRAFSVVRALAGAAGLGVDAGRERELSAEIARRSGRSFQGVAIPMAALAPRMERRDFTLASGGGSNIVQTDILADQTIDHLRNALVTRQLGAMVLGGLVGNVAIPKISADATAAWIADDSGLTESDPTVVQVSMSPKTVGAMTTFSRSLLLQGTPDVEMLVRGNLSAIIALALDSAAINGSGSSNQPTGILATSGIGSLTVAADSGNGGALAYDDVQDLMAKVANANAAFGSLGFCSNTKVRSALTKLKDSYARPYGLPLILQNTPAAWTNSVPSTGTKGSGSNLSTILYGNFADLIIGLWSELDVLVNPYAATAYAAGSVSVRVMTSADIAVRHPESFAAAAAIIA